MSTNAVLRRLEAQNSVDAALNMIDTIEDSSSSRFVSYTKKLK